MKQEIIIQDMQYVDQDHEAALNEIKSRLVSKCELQGKHDGAQEKPTTPGEHQALILNYIEVTLQDAIGINQNRYLPISGGAAAKLAEMEANKKEQELQSAINDEEHLLPDAINDMKKSQPDVKKMRMRKYILAGLLFVALSEGFLSYPAFRHFRFLILPSIIASIAVAVIVGFAAHYSGGYIKKTKNRTGEIWRYVISLIPAIIGFGVLGYMRAITYSHQANVQVGAQHVTAQSNGGASAVAIATISILFYLVALILSAHFFRTDAERLQEHKYEEKCKAVDELQKGIEGKKDEIVRIRYDKVKQMALAMKRYEYAFYQEQQLINFAQVAAEDYKQKNIRHRSECPAFFSNKPIFHFTTFFTSTKPQKHEDS